MRYRVLLVPSVHSLAALASLASAQVPFPIDKDQRLEELSHTFTVKGRMRLPHHVSIDATRALTIEGEGDATLEICGNVNMCAATGGKIEFRDVWIELTPECEQIRLANCIFRGRGGIRPSPDGPSGTTILLQQVVCETSASVTIEASNGSVLMDGCSLQGPVVLRGVPRSETVMSNFTISVYGSKSGSARGGFTVEGIKDGTIRTCDLAGSLSLFVDNRKLIFDGNNVRSQRVEFRDTTNGGFGGVKITKTDFRTKKLVLSSPPKTNKTERLTFDNCYFRGHEDLDTIRREMLEDGGNSESSAVAALRDVRAEPNGLGGNDG